MNSLAHLLLFVAMTTATDTVEIQNENLLMTRPDGYKTDFYEKTTDALDKSPPSVRVLELRRELYCRRRCFNFTDVKCKLTATRGCGCAERSQFISASSRA